MIPVLSREGEEIFERIAADHALLAFDFDGTLAPIVADRARAEMRPQTRALLRAVAAAYPCVVVSGRARADVARRLEDVPVRAVVGNHGAEPDERPPDTRVSVRVRAWAAALQEALGNLHGLELEVKGLSLSVHHRHADVGARDTARIATLAASLPGARVIGGDEVVNVVPLDAPTKGDAVEALAARERARTVLFVGDDVTDEDAFRSDAVAFPVRVGRDDRSAARYFLEEQGQIDELLRRLLAARGRHPHAAEWWKPSPPGFDRGGDP